jgi:hypothetical protein
MQKCLTEVSQKFNVDKSYVKNLVEPKYKYPKKYNEKAFDYIDKLYYKKYLSEQDLDDAEQYLRRVYVQKPAKVLGLIKQHNPLALRINYEGIEGCRNLHLISDDLVFYIDENKTKWCLTPEQWKEMTDTGYNFYTGRKLISNDFSNIPETNCGKIVEFKKLSFDARTTLIDWTKNTYTLNNVFFQVEYKTQIELSWTRPCRPVKLFRGIKFDSEKKRDDFINSAEDVEFTTFSSWTYDKKVANKFATHGDYCCGVVISMDVNKEDVLVDLTQIEPYPVKKYKHEKEVIVLPGNYKITYEIINKSTPSIQMLNKNINTKS